MIMTISDISRVLLAYVQESIFGQKVTGCNLQKVRLTGESLKLDTDIVNSNEIRPDRQIVGVFRTRVAVSGGLDFELSYGSFDDFLACVLMSANVKAQGTLTIDTLPTTTTDTITIGATTYRFMSTMAQANDIKIEAADLPGTLANLIATINGTGAAGVNYYAGTTSPHPSVRIGDFVSDDAIITAIEAGLAGNFIATTESFTAETNIFDAGTLGTTRAGAGWTVPVTVTASTISAAIGDSSFNDSGNGFGSIIANEWIRASGFTNAANNGYFKVASATAAKIIVYGTLVTESAGTSRTIKQGSSIVNGVTKNSFNFERTYSDLTTELALYKGCMLNQMTLTVGTNGIITGSFGMMGQIETSETVSGGDGYEEPNDNDVLNSIDHVQGIYENAVAIDVLDCSLTITNNLRERLKVGTLGPFSFGANAINVSGSFTAYYESKTLYDKYLNFDETSLAKVFEDVDGNAYVIDLPGVKITDGQRHSGAGMGDDFKVPCTFQAFMQDTEEITIRIVRFAA
jgi:hypothetical protein